MSNFFEELKNRNVYKVAVAYLVTAWLLLQIVDVVGPNLGWPDSVGALLIKILIVGFPIALVLTWLYEFTPKGLKLTGKVQEDTTDNRKAGRRLNRTIIGVLGVTLCFMLVERIFFAERTTINTTQKASIAVLPFEFQSTNTSLSFMSDAFSGAISDRLGKVSGLMVTSKTSSSQFKDRGADVREIGKNLDVNYLIEGDLQVENNRIRLRARLVNASNGYVRWQEQYDEEFSSIMEVEEDIAKRVVNELRIEVFPDESVQLSKRISENDEAYKLYLKARTIVKQRTDETLGEAINLLEEALLLEPNFAEAHAQLVIAYRLRNAYGELKREVAEEKMRIHYEKAKEIDPELAEVHFAAAWFNGYTEKNKSKIVASLRKAIQLNPSYSEAYYALSRQLWEIDIDSAIQSRIKAYELDPYNDFLSSMVAQLYKYNLRDEVMAMKVLDKILDKDPTANFCGRIKSAFIADAPNGDLAQSFITLYKTLQGDQYEAVNLGWMISYCLGLDLAPLAERYLNLRELKYPNNFGSFTWRYNVNSFKKDYKANLDLVNIWDTERGFPEGEKSYWLADVYLRLGNANKAKLIMDEGYPELKKQHSNINQRDSIPFSNFVDETDMYIDIYRALGNDDRADTLADISCDYYDQLIIDQSFQNTNQGHILKMFCYYNRHEVDSVVQKLDKVWFKEKGRNGLQLFLDIQSGYFLPFEDEPIFIDFSKRVTEETHRMRAEVIAYLKEVDDWNPAWDKELGLE